MIKRLISIALAMVGLVSISSSVQAEMPLPLNPNVKSGTLENGLKYYILHNEEPKGRANFYIAQKVGSTLESPEQLGLAHFLEHMAFNGTTNFPGKNMLESLQAKGIRFGNDINAYTSFDETVYNIDNIPTDDVELMKSVVMMLHDWSCEISLLDSEIDAERGVIQEEWRSRNDANTRMIQSILPQIYEEYQYQQTPIGKMEVVMNFPYSVLRDYYHKWYRPDQQGIIIVGDFDAAWMEEQVKSVFSTIKMPENAAERTYPSVSDNVKPIYAQFTDPEMQNTLVRIMFKREKLPFELRNTVEGFVGDYLAKNLFASMINTRLGDLANNASCKFAYAGVSFDDYMVSKTKGAFNVIILAKDDVQGAIDEAMAEIARSCKTGFTDGELQRAKDNMLSGFEKAYNERDKTKTSTLAKELIRHFIDNEPAAGAEAELDLVKQVLPMLPVQVFNEMGSAVLTAENQVIVVTAPESQKNTLPSEEVVVSAVNKAINAEYEAYVDDMIDVPMIQKAPKAGSVKQTTPYAFGSKKFTLSNGAQVVIKPTDFAADEIRFMAIRRGGRLSMNPANVAEMNLIDAAVECSAFGPYNSNMLQKYLAGKKVSLSYGTGMRSTTINGSSTKKDLPTLMELIYVLFTNLQPDQATYNAFVEASRPGLIMADKNPDKAFSDSVSATMYRHNPIMQPLDVAMLDKANYPMMLKMAKESMKNAAEYTFYFVGNVDENVLIPLLEKYIASLPAKKKFKVPAEAAFPFTSGLVLNEFETPMETPSTMVFNVASGDNLEYNIENSVKIDLLGDILGNVYTETLREEEGGTYSPGAAGQMSALTGKWMLIYQFQTNFEQQAKLRERAYLELKKLIENGATAEQFEKVKGAALNQYQINSRKNGYWMNQFSEFYFGNNMADGHEAAIRNLTLEDFNNFLHSINIDENSAQIVRIGVAK